MSRAQLTPQARVDLLEIWHYIAPQSLQNANKVWEDLKAGIRKVAESPWLGHVRKDVDDANLRFFAVHSFVIAYRPDTKPLKIVRIVSGYRDFAKIFNKR
jgi:plasmid stabilization system protein ParE